MLIKDIENIGKRINRFLKQFASCFVSDNARDLLKNYVDGLCSDVSRKNLEAIALHADVPPRTLQRFLETIQWDEDRLRKLCQKHVAKKHLQPESVGIVDETGVAKSGRETACVIRQYNGNRGKVENSVNHVALAVSTPGFSSLLDCQLYMPKEWADDSARRARHYIPEELTFKTKPQIAIELIERALKNGVEVMGWTADELYGNNPEFLDELDRLRQAYVVEVPVNTKVWLIRPAFGLPVRSEARNVNEYATEFRDQTPQRYMVRQSTRGPIVWEIRWHSCWRKTSFDAVSPAGTLIIARNVETEEVKYFLANRVPGIADWTIRKLLQIAFERWAIEDCFREAKEELGLDHYECRGWHCVHRHLSITILAQIFCAELRQELSNSEDRMSAELVTLEQTRRAVELFFASRILSEKDRKRYLNAELRKQAYYAKRNAQATKSHTKTKNAKLLAMGIDPEEIKHIHPKNGSD